MPSTPATPSPYGLRLRDDGQQRPAAFVPATDTSKDATGHDAFGSVVYRGSASTVPAVEGKLKAWRDAGADPAEKPRTFFRLTAVFDTLSRESRGALSGGVWNPLGSRVAGAVGIALAAALVLLFVELPLLLMARGRATTSHSPARRRTDLCAAPR
jgi:hypothetical protein